MLKTFLIYLFLCNIEDTVYGHSSWISYWLAKNFVPVFHTILWKNKNKFFGQPNTWKFAYSLKFTQNLKVNHDSTFSVIWRHEIINSGEKLGIWCVHSQLVRLNKVTPAFLSQLSCCKQMSFWLFSAKLFVFLCFLSVSSLFQMCSKHRAEVQSSIPKHKKTAMCLIEKICV